MGKQNVSIADPETSVVPPSQQSAQCPVLKGGEPLPHIAEQDRVEGLKRKEQLDKEAEDRKTASREARPAAKPALPDEEEVRDIQRNPGHKK